MIITISQHFLDLENVPGPCVFKIRGLYRHTRSSQPLLALFSRLDDQLPLKFLESHRQPLVGLIINKNTNVPIKRRASPVPINLL